jgi:hypothetical protein
MSISYADKRGRYSGVAPWQIPAGTPNSSNPVSLPAPKEEIAVRGTAPRDSFRTVTAEAPINPKLEWVQNNKGEWVQEPIVKLPVKPQDALKDPIATQTPSATVAPPTELPSVTDVLSSEVGESV